MKKPLILTTLELEVPISNKYKQPALEQEIKSLMYLEQKLLKVIDIEQDLKKKRFLISDEKYSISNSCYLQW